MENRAAAGMGDGAAGAGTGLPPQEMLLVMGWGGGSCWVAGQGQGVLWCGVQLLGAVMGTHVPM